MPVDPYAVLRALLRAEAARSAPKPQAPQAPQVPQVPQVPQAQKPPVKEGKRG
ncbi:hypothetical protein ACIGMX_15610 [Streptomyces aquilus]|uniref:hypothetical protein n=1 Tax=Streptomyces aquilus TaxID=2548456 RepID=UPI0037D5729A